MLATLFGLILICIMPPLQTPDETAHFLRIYEISELKFVPTQHNGVTGSYLPTSIATMIKTVNPNSSINFHPNVKYNLHATKAAMKIPLAPTQRSFYDTSATASYSPVGYLPQALAVLIGRLLHFSPIFLVYLSRIAILVSWIGMVCFSIKLIPYRKWTLATIALIPMMVAQSMSLGVDVLSIGASLLFLVLVLYTSRKETISRKLLIALILASVLMVLSKQIAILFIPLVFLIDKNKFRTPRKALIVKSLMILIPLLFLLIWMHTSAHVSQTVTQAANHQSSSGQVSFLLHKPFHIFKVMFDTFFFSQGDTILTSVIGNFGWMDTPLSIGIVIAGYCILTITLFCSYNEPVNITKRIRIVSLILAVIYFLGVCLALYIAYAPVGFNILLGVQGRYLLPLLFLLIPVFYSFSYMSKKRYILSTMLPMVLILCLSITTIIFRYYISYNF
jgi:uncharacterized membrane protein